MTDFRQQTRTFAVAALLVAATGPGTADACGPRDYQRCGEAREQCYINGGDDCEAEYMACLVARGCG